MLYVAGWLVASAVAIAILVLVADPLLRVTLSLAVGPLAGCAVFVAALARPQAIREPSSR